MQTIPTEEKTGARDFVSFWTGKGYEKGQTQPFWLSLLRILGIDKPETFIEFEDKAHIDSAHGFIDGYISATHVLVEQKSLGKSLRAGILQSDGSVLTPFQQAKRYAVDLPYSRRPRWVVTCNFAEFLLYDMEKPNAEPESLLLSELPEQLYRLRFLVDTGSDALRREEEISRTAGDVVGLIYDALLKQYRNPSSPGTLKSLNQLCVRLVFLLYAEDADVFSHLQFHDYMKQFTPAKTRGALIDLFKTLDTPIDKRDPYLDSDLAAFPYVNGGLFSDGNVEIPQFTDEILDLILSKASEDFDWKDISPTIFGAVFESTLNPETRRAGGMHYTSVANIHKVIDPLFLDELKARLSGIKAEHNAKKQTSSLRAYIDRLASLSFLDPACGSGNFLTETYISLRRLENEALSLLLGTQGQFDLEGNMIRVSLSQFHGFEINDFACHVAQTALWIAENQMLRETERIARRNFDFLPLKAYDGIVEGNALRMDWENIAAVPHTPEIHARRINLIEGEPLGGGADMPSAVREGVVTYDTVNVYTKEVHLGKDKPEQRIIKYDYIMGNPPFVGARLMSQEQKNDFNAIFGSNWKGLGNLDYVAGWYKKAVDYMAANPTTRAALVSTNSITQGDAVAILWKPLFERGVSIDFAYRTFRWNSESNSKARVHCVIVGFSLSGDGIGGTETSHSAKVLYDGEHVAQVPHINAYLQPAPDVFVESQTKPLCAVPSIGIGNKPIDGGNYLFTPDEKKVFLGKEPAAEPYFKQWIGADELLNGTIRFVLYLGKCPPDILRSLPYCMKRIKAVRDFRLASKSEVTRRIADNPTHFHVENIPKGHALIIPRHSSENRRYIPLGFMGPENLCGDANLMMADATLYHFGILTSNVHNAWMKVVAGRLKSDYRYSAQIVYNNFPWPEVTDEQRTRIEQTAQAILDARAKYSNASLADLYDELTMPPELRRAHQDNDHAVMAAYGFPPKMTESECVAELFRLYKRLVAIRK